MRQAQPGFEYRKGVWQASTAPSISPDRMRREQRFTLGAVEAKYLFQDEIAILVHLGRAMTHCGRSFGESEGDVAEMGLAAFWYIHCGPEAAFPKLRVAYAKVLGVGNHGGGDGKSRGSPA